MAGSIINKRNNTNSLTWKVRAALNVEGHLNLHINSLLPEWPSLQVALAQEKSKIRLIKTRRLKRNVQLVRDSRS